MTNTKKVIDSMFNQIQDNKELTNYPMKPFIPQSKTLGTTMEEKIQKILKNPPTWTDGDPRTQAERIMDLLAQSKTDLLNALIEREETRRKYVGSNDIIFYTAKTDTINHLKSLRDT